MTINFFEPGDVPKHRNEVKIELLEAEVYPDRQRIHMKLNVTPFLERPNFEVTLTRVGETQPVATLSIVETMHPRMEFTMHLRTGNTDPAGDYVLRAVLFFRVVTDTEAEALPEAIIQDTQEITIRIPTKDQ